MTKELNTTLRGVYTILQQYPLTRNSDLHLIFYYLKRFGGCRVEWTPDFVRLDIPRNKVRDGWSVFETIRRTRQKIQNEMKLFLPTDEGVRRQRKIKEEAWKSWSVQKNLFEVSQ